MIKKSLLKIFILLSFASFEGNANNTSSDQDETIKIVTLSPHLAEMIYELGSESSLVGVSSFTDYPESAKSIPRIGDAFVLDLERMALLDPDVILAWESGTPRKVVEELDNQGYRLEIIKSNNLNEISAALNQIGQIVDKQEQARVIIKKYSDQLKDLKEKYKNINLIENNIKNLKDPFNRDLNLKKTKIDETYPEYIQKNKELYKEWILQ